MSRERIEFTIHPDGTVEERTIGIAGEACEQATAGVEAALGEIVHREATAERYQASVDEEPPVVSRRRDD